MGHFLNETYYETGMVTDIM